MWLIVPVQGKLKDFFADFDKYPFQTGSSLNASGIEGAGCHEAFKGIG
jgi:hypothetical protein